LQGSLWVEAFRSLILGGKPLAAGEVSEAVYERSPSGPRGLVYAALAVALGAAVVVTAVMGVGALAYLLLLLAPPALFFLWVYRSDRYEPEPGYLVTVAFSLGIFSGMTVDIVSQAIPLAQARYLVEAAVVFLVLLWLASGEFSAEFNDHMDGLVYGAAVGLGLVTAYNYAYAKLVILAPPTLALLTPAAQLVAESLLSLSVVAVAAIAGRWLGWVKALKGSVGLADGLPGLALYAVLRLLYWAAESASTVLPVNPLPPLLLAAYWAVVWRFTREALRDEMLWGYTAGRAPVER